MPKGRDVVTVQAVPFGMSNVRLGPGAFSAAAEANRRYLKTLPPDRLLHTFRLTAGLPSSAEPLGDWEKPDCELRGHFAGGHYLSACALLSPVRATKNLSATANLWSRNWPSARRNTRTATSAPSRWNFRPLARRREVWAPFYTIHKVMAGHLDMYMWPATNRRWTPWRRWQDGCGLVRSTERTTNAACASGGIRRDGRSARQSLRVTGKREYLNLAQRFDKKSFLDPLAAHRDELKGLHVNTHVPQVIAAARLYELTGDKRYWSIADYFWDEVTSERCYCTGGTSNFELWRSDPGVLSTN